ncbi:MAG: crossover junction endodeoxyribonuclease RuvC [Candidatus Omnitrophica bacterium]|nr:crossover junction endodeoxyribonuclease RuvC [Candidatus Omnitrophota bacterium]
MWTMDYKMRILGIDPGLVRTGYGLIEAESPGAMRLVEAGVIRTKAGDHIQTRVADIFNSLSDIIRSEKPDVLVLEKIYSHYKHPATAILMGHARGVVCLACGLYGVELVNYPATRIKKAITGNGHASKQQVQGSVKTLLRLRRLPEPADVSDALAMAISFVYMGGARKKTVKF